MRFVSTLALSNFTTHRIRAALTIAAIAFSVSLVVATTSGYLSVEETARQFFGRFMGAADVQVTRKSDPHGGVKESLVDELAKDPDVRGVVGRLEAQGGSLDPRGQGRNPPMQIVGIRRPQDKRVESMTMLKGQWFETDDGNVAVIDQVAAELRKIDIGGSFDVPGPHGRMRLKVVGIVQKPVLLAAQMQSVYLPIKTLQKFVAPDRPGEMSRVMIDLKPQVSSEAFAARWREKLTTIDPTLKLTLAGDSRKAVDQNLEGIKALSYLGGTVSMLAAMFIVFSALSMGVAERSRTLAMLRAVGAVRGQIGWLVVVEGLMLAIAGVAIGVPLGWLWLKLLSLRFDDIFATTGVILSTGGVTFAAVGTVLAALVASFLPAWSAMRVSPLEAMSNLATSGSSRLPWKLALVGLLLIGVDAAILYGFDPRAMRDYQFYSHFVLGVPSLMIGFFLLAPLFVRFVEVVIGPVVAAMLGLRFSMLRQQLSSGVWRAAGTCAALMVGLAILVVLQTQGHSMIGGWKLPDKFPDIFIVAPVGTKLSPGQIQNLAETKGIKKGDLLPIYIAAPGLGEGWWAIAGSQFLPNSTMLVAVDPNIAERMLDLDFRAGNAKDAWAKLRQGRHVIVTEEFRQLKGLGVGDKIDLITSKNGKVPYTIAGIVWSPGMDVFYSLYDMSLAVEERTAATVFGSAEDAKNDFGVDSTSFFAANLESGIEKEKLMKQVQRELRGMNMKAGDVRQIKAGLQTGFRHILDLASTVAFAAMAVASLGVTNTIMASIRSRRWQFGVLRSVGFTRSQLLRLVLAEAILLGVVGCAMGLIAGLEMSINARQFTRIVIGYIPPMVIPYAMIAIGTAIVMLISILASLWPAASVARTEPLTLLQAGRAAA